MAPDSHRPRKCSPPICGCRCGCACCTNHKQSNISRQRHQLKASSPLRGRSPTPKYDRTNGNGKPITPCPAFIDNNSPLTSTNASVQGEEGLATHQLQSQPSTETHNPKIPASNSFQHQLHDGTEHNTCIYNVSSPSPSASLLVEPSTTAPSLASSGVLPAGTAASTEELLLFTDGGFESEAALAGGRECAFTPLWLGHDVRFSRNSWVGDGAGSEAGTGYLGTLELS